MSAGGCEQDKIVFRLEDIGWDAALSKFTGIDKETFAELVPLVLGDEFQKVFDRVEKAPQRMQGQQGVSRSPPVHEVWAHVKQMRTQRWHLKRRRAEFLKGEHRIQPKRPLVVVCKRFTHRCAVRRFLS